MVAILLFALLSAPPARSAERGEAVYARECAACHGRNGTPYIKDDRDALGLKRGDDGAALVDAAAAPRAAALRPLPRDFTRGAFKIRSTPSGELPTDEDLIRSISRGLPGSAMAGFGGRLSKQEISDAASYVKTFSPRFKAEKISKTLPPAPEPEASEASGRRGRELYFENGCASCHGREGRGDGGSAGALRDDWGRPAVPANFHRPERLRGGSSRRDLYRSLMTGFNGTPMGGYWDVLESTADGWHLADYLASLGRGAR